MGDNVKTEECPVILYHYKFSPYARRIQWYLALRGIPYVECLQPPILPRPDITALGLSYRRIPILAIGRDIYLDTRLQIAKLESSPQLAKIAPPLSSTASSSGDTGRRGEHALIESLLSRWTNDTGLFPTAASLIPPDLPVVKDPKFVKDRRDFFGSSPSSSASSSGSESVPKTAEEQLTDQTAREQKRAIARATALETIKSALSVLETTILSDNRTWILDTAKPTLADVEAGWLFHWLVVGLPGSLDFPVSVPSSPMAAAASSTSGGETKTGVPYVKREDFPRLFRYLGTLTTYLASAAARPSIRRLAGPEAHELLLASSFHEESPIFDEKDALGRALGLRREDRIAVNPTDTGRGHRDLGRVVGLGEEEVVWAAETKDGGGVVRVHAPRRGFMVTRVEAGGKGKL